MPLDVTKRACRALGCYGLCHFSYLSVHRQAVGLDRAILCLNDNFKFIVPLGKNECFCSGMYSFPQGYHSFCIG